MNRLIAAAAAARCQSGQRRPRRRSSGTTALQELHQPEQEVPARPREGRRERPDERDACDELQAQHEALQTRDVVQPGPDRDKDGIACEKA